MQQGACITARRLPHGVTASARWVRTLAATPVGSSRCAPAQSSRWWGSPHLSLGVLCLHVGCRARKGRGDTRCFSSSWASAEVRPILDSFDPQPGVEEASTPPGSWYTSRPFYDAEADTVFRRNWLHVGRVDQLPQPGSFFTGMFLGQPYIVVRTESGDIRAMYNVCAHHAALVVQEEQGHAEEFVCPYHGWCYKTDGRLCKTHKLSGMKNFRARDYGLKPIQVDTLGPFVFINFSEEPLAPVCDILGEAVIEPLEGYGRLDQLRFVRRVLYEVKCNWKVFCDNYLDGGYHVPIAHPALAAGLDESAYTITAVRHGTLQNVRAAEEASEVEASAEDPPASAEDESQGSSSPSRLGRGARYAFAYPNFMLNRYGPWLDTNTVVPLGVDRSAVIFDYFLDEAELREADPQVDVAAFIDSSLRASDQVQHEDEHLCRIVQQGLTSRGYSAGRYVPKLEHGMYAFHQHLHADVSSALEPAS